ncbi:MAG: MerR family transcriptional regulator, partial [Nonomuraea sp.]|nr:MerR family transcriptional regulator [Nonomuraea sp.]
RRYGPTDLLRLVQVRTRAAAGVPLAEIGPLLDAEPDRFAAALGGVEQHLTDRIDELVARRDTLRRLAGGDRALLPERACALLDRAEGLGFTPEEVAIYRESLVLVRALVPGGFDDYLADVERALEDTGFVELVKRCWVAKDWDPGDPRLDELATAMAAGFLANPALLAVSNTLQSRVDTTRYGLLNHYGEEQEPTMAELTALVESKLRAAGVNIPYQ